MPIKPYVKPRPHREMCWLIDQNTILHESGIELDFTQIDKHMQVWSSADLVIDLLSKGIGEALTWDGKPIRWSPIVGTESWPVSVMRLTTPDDPVEALAGLEDWRDWLEDYGAAPAGSLGGSGFSLLKATLTAPLWTCRGELPPIRFTLGGRQELGPQGAPYTHQGALQHWDLQAAYARTLGNLRYGGHWAAVSKTAASRLGGGADRMLYVHARVRIPEQTWCPLLGPLPDRPRNEPTPLSSLILPVTYPTGRVMQGTWTWPELVQAERWGCRITSVLGGWHHYAKPDQFPFRPWLRAVEQGRRMDGFAGLLAKATGNATWGQFAIRRDGQRAATTVQIVNGKRKQVKRQLKQHPGGNPSQRAYELAEYICGKVRAELYRGMMQADADLICAHTDGLWLRGPFYIQGWRLKDTATSLRLISPQTIAYRREEDDNDTYVVSGVRSQAAQPFFEDAWERMTA